MLIRSDMRTFTIAASIVTFALTCPAIASTTIVQRVNVQGITATTTVSPLGDTDLQIQTTFASSTYPVGCLSAYRDMRYELRNSANRVVLIDSRTLQHPPYDGPRTLVHVTTNAPRRDCSHNAPQGSWFTQAYFSALYPNLEPGRYILIITFGPRSARQSATLTPITLTVDNAHHVHLDAPGP